MRTHTHLRPLLLALTALAVTLGAGYYGQANAQLIDDTTDLPPDGVYLTPQDVHAIYGDDPAALEIVLRDLIHQPFVPGRVDTDPATGDEMHEFESLLTGVADLTLGTDVILGIPVALTGPVQTVARGRGGNDTGTWQTEMISMSLSGDVGGLPVMVNESPTLQSLGQTTITDIGGGQFQIDSFFDVFTELTVPDPTSLVGATLVIPVDNGPSRVVLQGHEIPEPASAILLCLGLGSLLRSRRR